MTGWESQSKGRKGKKTTAAWSLCDFFTRLWGTCPLTSFLTHTHRVCIRPEVSRTKTFGKVGVSSGLFYNQHLQHIVLNTNAVNFSKKNLTYLLEVWLPHHTHCLHVTWPVAHHYCISPDLEYIWEGVCLASACTSCCGRVRCDVPPASRAEGAASKVFKQEGLWEDCKAAENHAWHQGELMLLVSFSSYIIKCYVATLPSFISSASSSIPFPLPPLSFLPPFPPSLQGGVPRTAYKGIVSTMYNGQRVHLTPPSPWRGYESLG